MTWNLRLSGPDLYHHIYAWGNDRHSVFLENHHYEYYLQCLKKYSKMFAVDILAYALMEWHVHLFIYDRDDNMSSFMKRLHGVYAVFFNRDADRVGHVFGERFNNKIVQPNIYALRLSKYIHRQAVEAGLVDHPLHYRWTSYQVYCGLEKTDFIKPGIVLDQFDDGQDRHKAYASFVMSEKKDDDPLDWDKARMHVVGDDRFRKYIIDTHKSKKKKRNIPDVDPLRFACDKMGVSRKILLNPSGRREREIRHRAICMLVNNQGYTKTCVAHALRISRMAVMNILNKESMKKRDDN